MFVNGIHIFFQDLKIISVLGHPVTFKYLAEYYSYKVMWICVKHIGSSCVWSVVLILRGDL